LLGPCEPQVAEMVEADGEGAEPPAKIAKGEGDTDKRKTGNTDGCGAGINGIGRAWGVEVGRVPRPQPGESVTAALTYQGDGVPRSLDPSGKVYTIRDGAGSDTEYFGCDFARRDVQMTNGRGKRFTLDEHGFTLVDDVREHVDYGDEQQILETYYPACAELVRKTLGAKEAYAFDHNVRSDKLKGATKYLKGGNAVQGPLFFVHNDYSRASAPRRVRDLATPPKFNDTLRKVLGERPLIDPHRVDDLLAGRFAIVNVWRNIKKTPLQRLPLGLCDGSSVPKNDIVTFEIRYKDRVGENYFAGKSDGHRWYYFPDMVRDEAILLKCWDSAGKDFAPPECIKTVPSTFSIHTAFEDPSTPPEADDRESIEVRTVAFF